MTLEPSCLLTPKSSEEASQVLKFIAQHKIPFAVRGGGHNSNRGWANINGKASVNGGILVSTAQLKSLELCEDGEGQILKVGVGLPLLDLYEFMDGKDITIAASNTTAPGLGGLLLGGGMGGY